MNRMKDKGTKFETLCARHLQAALPWLDISRQTLAGPRDTGDIRGLEAGGMRLAVECKDTREPRIFEHVGEAIREAGNAGADGWILVQHMPGVNPRTPEGMDGQLVCMSMRTFLTLVRAARKEAAE